MSTFEACELVPKGQTGVTSENIDRMSCAIARCCAREGLDLGSITHWVGPGFLDISMLIVVVDLVTSDRAPIEPDGAGSSRRIEADRRIEAESKFLVPPIRKILVASIGRA